MQRKTIARKTKTLVLEALAKARASGAIVAPARGSVGEWLERWLADVARPRVDAGTYPQYANIVRRHIAPAIGEIELARLDPACVRAFYGDLARREIGSATQRQIHALLRSAMKTAVEWDLIASYVIAMMVGIRQGEIFGMQWGDLEWSVGRCGCSTICKSAAPCA